MKSHLGIVAVTPVEHQSCELKIIYWPLIVLSETFAGQWSKGVLPSNETGVVCVDIAAFRGVTDAMTTSMVGTRL